VARVAVMGAGSWGTAFASVVSRGGHDTRLWARRAELAEAISKTHENLDYLPGVKLPVSLRATSDPREALVGAEVVALALPSHALREGLVLFRPFMPAGAPLVSLTKGIEGETLMRMSEVIRDVTGAPAEQVAVLSGPNLAGDIARRLPSATVVATPDPLVAIRLQKCFQVPYFQVYMSPDVVGTELGGATKNYLAIAVGMAEGVGLGDNAKALLVTLGLSEMTRLGMRLGANPLTFSGLAGIGDLLATCMSRQSRNRHVGEQLGRGRRLDEIFAEMRMVAEGVKLPRAVVALARRERVEMPIAENVGKVLYEGMSPKDMLLSLLSRQTEAGMAAIRPARRRNGIQVRQAAGYACT